MCRSNRYRVSGLRVIWNVKRSGFTKDRLEPAAGRGGMFHPGAWGFHQTLTTAQPRDHESLSRIP
jgi:hypothetical protein